MTRPSSETEESNGWISFLVNFGPLLAFFVAYRMAGPFVGTGVFMIAILLATIVSLVRYRRVSPMTWLSAVLVIGFGGLTLWLHEERFIQMKPTAIYAGLGALLAAGLLRGKPLLRPLLGQIFPGLTHRGWMLLSRNWAIFFIALALINEAMREFLSFDAWLTLKVWGVTAVTLIFSAANMPMLLRHGLDPEKTSPVAQAPPNQ